LDGRERVGEKKTTQNGVRFKIFAVYCVPKTKAAKIADDGDKFISMSARYAHRSEMPASARAYYI
jgi:hypothetical protein